MNDQEFEQRATANPFDESVDFLEALAEKPNRQILLEELKAFDSALKQGVHAIHPSQSLKKRLLNIPLNEANKATPMKAINDSHLWARKTLPIAACLLVVIALIITALPLQHMALEREVLAHIYEQENFLEVDTVLSMPEVNQKTTATLGFHLENKPELDKLVIHVAENCWVDKKDSIHMVIEGNAGAVTIMMIPSSPLKETLSIADERFNGVIMPTLSGNLVVVGEKGEDISEYGRFIAGNFSW